MSTGDWHTLVSHQPPMLMVIGSVVELFVCGANLVKLFEIMPSYEKEESATVRETLMRQIAAKRSWLVQVESSLLRQRWFPQRLNKWDAGDCTPENQARLEAVYAGVSISADAKSASPGDDAPEASESSSSPQAT